MNGVESEQRKTQAPPLTSHPTRFSGTRGPLEAVGVGVPEDSLVVGATLGRPGPFTCRETPRVSESQASEEARRGGLLSLYTRKGAVREKLCTEFLSRRSSGEA